MTGLAARRYKSSTRNLAVTLVAWASVVLLLVTMIFLLTKTRQAMFSEATAAEARSEALPFLIFWAVVPPLWFWGEYHLIWLTAPVEERGNFDQFKHSQEQSRNIWVAILALVGGLFFKL